MPNIVKIKFLDDLREKFGEIKKLPNSQSLFEIGNGLSRIYVRYSKIHSRNQAFYGIRKDDLKELEGFNSFICFLYNNQQEPIFIPFDEFEEIFNSLTPSSDGQIKSSIFVQEDGIQLYISNSGRFNVEGYLGWNYLIDKVDLSKLETVPSLTHSQIQTLLGSVGIIKGYDIWIPSVDRNKLDWNCTRKFDCIRDLPTRYESINQIIREVDIIWLKRGSSEVSALFEVEHSTPIYSGLLRFNDLHIIEPSLKPKYSIVSNDVRRSLFFRQINRPTFKASGLIDFCSFLNYKDVYFWHNRILKDYI
jgi:hypothetical protein